MASEQEQWRARVLDLEQRLAEAERLVRAHIERPHCRCDDSGEPCSTCKQSYYDLRAWLAAGQSEATPVTETISQAAIDQLAELKERARAAVFVSPDAPATGTTGEELPQSIAGIAPDFTDGLESAEYLRRRWAGEPTQPPADVEAEAREIAANYLWHFRGGERFIDGLTGRIVALVERDRERHGGR